MALCGNHSSVVYKLLNFSEHSKAIYKKLEQKISYYIRRWLRLHHTISNIVLYSSVSPCPLPVSSLTSVLKASKISGYLLLRDSNDPSVSQNCPEVNAGRWSASDSVKLAESELAFRDIMGYQQQGRSGFGAFKKKSRPPKGTHAYRKLLSDISSQIDSEESFAKAAQLHLQGNWVRWCDYIKLDLSWKSLMSLPQPLVSFCIQSAFNILPCPSNLFRWKLSEDSSCSLCKSPKATIAHVLSGCKIALDQQRYTYRHDSILRVIVDCLNEFLSSY